MLSKQSRSWVQLLLVRVETWCEVALVYLSYLSLATLTLLIANKMRSFAYKLAIGLAQSSMLSSMVLPGVAARELVVELVWSLKDLP